MPKPAFFCISLLLVLNFIAFSSAFAQTEGAKLTTWEEAQIALKEGNRDESLRLLRICSFSGDKVREAETELKRLLASESAQLVQKLGQNSLTPADADALMIFYDEISSLTISNADEWKILLLAASRSDNPEKLVMYGEKFLDRLRSGLKVSFDGSWAEPLKKLSPLLKDEWQIIYRWQVNKILATLPETQQEFKTEAENAGILAQTRARAVVSLAEVAMAMGDIEVARKHLDQVRFFNPEFPELDKMYARLKKVADLQKLQVQADQAFQKRDFTRAQKYCEDIIKLDEHNFFAKEMQTRIEEAKGHKPGGVLSAADQTQLKIRRLEGELKKAEKNEDILQMRNLIKELLVLVSDVKLIKKFEDLEREIQESRVHAEERFNEANRLFASGEYEKLRLFLNRNPGVMSSMDRMVQVWEMKLMVNYYSGVLGPIELANSAQNILLKGGKSFYAYFILMKLALAENRMEQAREHYKNAYALKPDFPGLRWPGWLLWIHGEGRYLVVGVLIVVLFFLIKLIRPAFEWFESTYWTRAKILSSIFPSLALRSLEGCFGTVNSNYERREMFRLLVKCCEKTGNTVKGLKYAENLLEISADDDAAISLIGSCLLKQPEVSQEKLPLLIKHALNHKENKDIIEKTGKVIKKTNRVKTDQIDFLRLYAQKFNEDKEMFALIGRCFLEIPASELPDSAISMLEIAWKATDSDELWWNLWRTQMFNGKFELALHLTEEAIDRKKPIVPEKLLEVYDREQMAEATVLVDQLNSFDQKTVIKVAKEILLIKYVSAEMGGMLQQTLERLLHEENPDLANAARQALDHVKARVRASEGARAKMLSIGTASIVESSRLDDEQMHENPEELAEEYSPEKIEDQETGIFDFSSTEEPSYQGNQSDLHQEPPEFAEPVSENYDRETVSQEFDEPVSSDQQQTSGEYPGFDFSEPTGGTNQPEFVDQDVSDIEDVDRDLEPEGNSEAIDEFAYPQNETAEQEEKGFDEEVSAGPELKDEREFFAGGGEEQNSNKYLAIDDSTEDQFEDDEVDELAEEDLLDEELQKDYDEDSGEGTASISRFDDSDDEDEAEISVKAPSSEFDDFSSEEESKA
ncbi:MAG: hypothetical protein AB1403_15615, partial [Candidatus Riflebacteria bacterium]